MRRTSERGKVDQHVPAAALPVAKIVWNGPRLGMLIPTEYYLTQIKGRCTERRRNDALIKKAGHVARLQLEEEWRNIRPQWHMDALLHDQGSDSGVKR